MGRCDGKRLKINDLMYTIVPHVMCDRNDAINYIRVDLPYEAMHEYLNRKRKEGNPMSYLSLITAAYVRTVAEFPFLNRFIVNRKIYARNEISVCMVVLRANQEDETMDKLRFEPTDTIYDVNRKMVEFISKNRVDEDETNGLDKIMKILNKLDWLLGPAVKVLKWMDKHNILPKAIIDAIPFHCSMVVSNLASIRQKYIFHHIYNFGTVGQVITIGTTEEIPHQRRDGSIYLEKVIPLGVATDERLGSGLMYTKAFKRIEKYLRNPELLEVPPEVVNYD